jgi:hypothetical protein
MRVGVARGVLRPTCSKAYQSIEWVKTVVLLFALGKSKRLLAVWDGCEMMADVTVISKRQNGRTKRRSTQPSAQLSIRCVVAKVAQ